MKLGDEETWGRHCNKLCLFQSRYHHSFCLAHPLRAHHHLLPPWHHAYSPRHVSERQTLIEGARGLTTKLASLFGKQVQVNTATHRLITLGIQVEPVVFEQEL